MRYKFITLPITGHMSRKVLSDRLTTIIHAQSLEAAIVTHNDTAFDHVYGNFTYKRGSIGVDGRMLVIREDSPYFNLEAPLNTIPPTESRYWSDEIAGYVGVPSFFR